MKAGLLTVLRVTSLPMEWRRLLRRRALRLVRLLRTAMELEEEVRCEFSR